MILIGKAVNMKDLTPYIHKTTKNYVKLTVSKYRMNIQFLLSVMPEVLNRASSQDFKTPGFPLNTLRE